MYHRMQSARVMVDWRRRQLTKSLLCQLYRRYAEVVDVGLGMGVGEAGEVGEEGEAVGLLHR